MNLTREIAPDECDLAPLILEAYLAGKEQRESLFNADIAPEGSFVPIGSLFVLPNIIYGISLASTFILQLISSTATVNEALSAVCNVLTVREHLQQMLSLKGEKPDQVPASQGGVDDSIKQIISIIDGQLKKTSLPEDERDLTAYRILRNLLEQPECTVEAIKQLRASK